GQHWPYQHLPPVGVGAGHMQGAERWLVPFAAVIATAWLVLALDGSVFSLPAFCSTGGMRALPLAASFDLALLTNGLPRFAVSWMRRAIAMMLPLALPPLRHVHERSFARRRWRAMLLFAAGFIAVWMALGIVLGVLAWLLDGAIAAPLGIGLAIALA